MKLRRVESTGTSESDLPVAAIGTAPLRCETAKLEDDDESRVPHDIHPLLPRHQ